MAAFPTLFRASRRFAVRQKCSSAQPGTKMNVSLAEPLLPLEGRGLLGTPVHMRPTSKEQNQLGVPKHALARRTGDTEGKEMALEHRHINEEIAQVGAEGGREKSIGERAGEQLNVLSQQRSHQRAIYKPGKSCRGLCCRTDGTPSNGTRLPRSALHCA